jgi:hypothetical protein
MSHRRSRTGSSDRYLVIGGIIGFSLDRWRFKVIGTRRRGGGVEGKR